MTEPGEQQTPTRTPGSPGLKSDQFSGLLLVGNPILVASLLTSVL